MPSTKPLELTNLQSRRWMTRLLMRAEHLGSLGEVPVSAVVIDANGRCIGHGSNQRQRMRDPLGHAELIALRQAAWLKSDWRFNDCTLIVTLEPCPMCAAALTQARMGQVIFAARDPKRGGLGSTINLALSIWWHINYQYSTVYNGNFLGAEVMSLAVKSDQSCSALLRLQLIITIHDKANTIRIQPF